MWPSIRVVVVFPIPPLRETMATRRQVAIGVVAVTTSSRSRRSDRPGPGLTTPNERERTAWRNPRVAGLTFIGPRTRSVEKSCAVRGGVGAGRPAVWLSGSGPREARRPTVRFGAGRCGEASAGSGSGLHPPAGSPVWGAPPWCRAPLVSGRRSAAGEPPLPVDPPGIGSAGAANPGRRPPSEGGRGRTGRYGGPPGAPGAVAMSGGGAGRVGAGEGAAWPDTGAPWGGGRDRPGSTGGGIETLKTGVAWGGRTGRSDVAQAGRERTGPGEPASVSADRSAVVVGAGARLSSGAPWGACARRPGSYDGGERAYPAGRNWPAAVGR